MNVLLITTDEQHVNTLGCYGNSHIRTPNLDRLACKGVRFINHTCANPLCTPARASILNGQYPRTHGAFSVGVELDKNGPMLSKWLKDKGYATGIMGKAHFEAELSYAIDGLDHKEPYYGFDTYHLTEDIHSQEYLEWVRHVDPEQYGEAKRNCSEQFAEGVPAEGADAYLPEYSVYASKMTGEVHPSTWITNNSIEFMRACKSRGEPFFLWTSYVDPHHPWNPIEPFASMYDPSELPVPVREAGAHGGPTSVYNDGTQLSDKELQQMRAFYYGMISHIDTKVGQMLAFLETEGQLEETLVIFTSDHGDYNGRHSMIRKIAGLYDDILRVPMIVRKPGSGAAGGIYEGMTQHQDIAPTIMELLGYDIPGSVQGYSLAKALDGTGSAERKYSFLEIGGPLGVARGPWKLVYYNRGLRAVLTNTETDPDEMQNLAGLAEYADVMEELKGALCRWLLTTQPWLPTKEFGF